MRLTTRGEIVIATLATLVFVTMIGFAGWVEGGMQ